jgi:methyltransferase (TIGR00027 family)
VNKPEPLIRDISDTARWVAIYRARESERPDAVFRDPLARRLAGERGEQIARSIPFSEKNAWSFVARTWLFDKLILEQMALGTDLVVNLAAGLDTRPYRLALPAGLRWVEVDLPPLVAYKEQALAGETPVCRLERVALDLADVAARRALFAKLGASCRRALVVSEGLIIYLTPEEVGALATDLAAPPTFRSWIVDLGSPALLAMLQRRMGSSLEEAGAPLKFAPAEGMGFYEPYGWKGLEAHSLFHTAARLRRLSFMLRLLARFLAPEQFAPNRPGGGVCLLGRT